MHGGDFESVPDDIDALLAREEINMSAEELAVFERQLRQAIEVTQDPNKKWKLCLKLSALIPFQRREEDILPEYAADIELVDLNKIVAEEGKAATKRHWLRTLIHTVFQAVFAGFMTIARLNLISSMKYVLSSASIPIEIINLIANIEKVVRKQKPWYVLTGVILTGLAAMGILAIMDAVRWGGWQSGVFATIASFGPFVFTAILGTVAVLNIARSISEALHFIRNPEYATPAKRFALAHQIAKTVGFCILASVVIPFMGFVAVGNPVGASILLGVIVATLTAMIVIKIVKSVRENREWKKTIADLKEENVDPYKRLGIDENTLANKLTDEATAAGKHEKGLKGLGQRLKNFGNNFVAIWRTSFGTAEQKAEIEAAKKATAASYIKECYEAQMLRLVPSYQEVVNQRKNIKDSEALIAKYTKDLAEAKRGGRIDKVPDINLDLNQEKDHLKCRKENLAKARKDFREEIATHPEGKELMQVYNLIRKERGRKQWQDANAPKEKVERPVAKSFDDERDVSVEDALNPSAYGNPVSGHSSLVERNRDRDPLLGQQVKPTK